MRDQLRFTPEHDTAQAFETFVEARCRGGALDRDRVGSLERRLVQALRRTVSADG
jgi:hypothetical protein